MRNTDDKRPRGPKPVTEIEVSESHIKPRVILAAVFLIIGIAAFGAFLVSVLNTEPGWQTVEIDYTEASVAGEFTLNYLFGSSGRDATTENRLLTSIYSDACVKAYKLFDAELLFDGVNNVRYINDHVNEEIEVDPVLYEAFERLEAHESRYLYLAPVYDEYDAAFFGIEMPAWTAEMDPYTDGEFAAYLAVLAEYAGSAEHIDLKLLGDNRVMLFVSDEYLDFANEYGVGSYIDFYRTKNAFIIDYFAELLINNGFTCATITSVDGYTRNLDASGGSYVFNIFDRAENTVYLAAQMSYSAPASIVFLYDYPLSEYDTYRYFVREDGSTITPFIDPADGLYRNAVSNMVAYSGDMTCADILLRLMPVYIADKIDKGEIAALESEGIDVVWCEDAVVYHTDESILLDEIYKSDDVSYVTSHVTE